MHSAEEYSDIVIFKGFKLDFKFANCEGTIYHPIKKIIFPYSLILSHSISVFRFQIDQHLANM